jgi:capsule polysaccharide modification protein KpsS
MGTAVYDMPGLTYEGSLDDFLTQSPLSPPDQELYESFRRYLLHVNQVNGSFYKRLPGRTTGTGFEWFPGLPQGALGGALPPA